MKWIFCVLPTILLAQELPSGQLIEEVTTKAVPDQGYSLYLPSKYNSNQTWPVLYCFDPGARGRIPVERFRKAAEQFGFIVAGSNNSRNGSWQNTKAAMEAMWNDTHERFQIDPKRAYAAGFSGGARVACAWGQNGKFLAGVIACGAGFPQAQAPKSIPFAIFGAVGIDDFNYPEMIQMRADLASLPSPGRVEVFAGGHEWLPESLAVEAVEWLEIEAMRAGLRPKDDATITSALAHMTAKADSLEQPESYYELKYLAETFRGLRDVSAYDRKASAAKQAKEFVRAESKQSSEVDRQRQLVSDMFNLANAAEGQDRLRQTIFDLRKQDDRPTRRAIRGMVVAFYESSREKREQKDYVEAARQMEIVAQLQPDRWNAHYELAAIYALKGDNRRAIGSLRNAVKFGFSDWAEADKDPDLGSIRGDAEYQKLRLGVRKSRSTDNAPAQAKAAQASMPD